jgi:hypothetical protein
LGKGVKIKDSLKNNAFIHPSGFIEQNYNGEQTPESILQAIDQLKQLVEKVRMQKKPVLILIDLSGIHKVDLGPRMMKARIAGMKAMATLKYQGAAIYGPVPLQVLVNTFAMIAGVHEKIHVFDSRAKAMKWLRADDRYLPGSN